MNRETHDETASAAMDGEADELELRRLLNQVAQDPDARARWARYQIARDALHQQPLVLPKLDIAAAVSAALAQEETPTVVEKAVPRSSSFMRFGVAASVTLAVMLGARWYNQTDATLNVAAQATPPASSAQWQVKPAPAVPAVLASFPTTPTDATPKPLPVEPQALPPHEPRR